MKSHGPKRVKKLAETTALVTGGAVRVGRAIALAPAIQVNAVGRHGAPDDGALAVCFFAACPRYITGQLLFVDGGATAV